MSKKQFVVSLEVPKDVNYKKFKHNIPLISSNLLLASEVIKLRLLQEKGSYDEKEIYELIFTKLNFWMDLLSGAIERLHKRT